MSSGLAHLSGPAYGVVIVGATVVVVETTMVVVEGGTVVFVVGTPNEQA